jgi:selenocysteine lyase/cysteine desulfurase
MRIVNQKSLFNIPNDIVFMNCANMSPHLKSVSEAGFAAIKQRNEPWTIHAEQWFEPAEELKQLFSTIINCKKQNIALVPSVSYGMAIAKNNIHLNASDEIIVLNQQYPSNIYVWRELSKETGAKIVTVKKEDNQTWTESIIDNINEKTGLVAIPNCHWTNGGLVDLIAISNKTKKFGAKLVIDASQSAGAFPLDIQKIKPDFLVTVGYKWLLGPYGLAYFYGDEKYFESGKPIEYTWLDKSGSEDFTKLVDYTDEYKQGASRFDAGEFPAFINIPMAKAALKQIINWGVGNIQETLSILTKQISDLASKRGISVSDPTHAGHMLGLKLEENKAKEIGTKLTDNGIYISFRGSSMRIAPHLYNDQNDIEKLFRFL